MARIQLPRGVWRYDAGKPIGERGGFGIVFEGTTDDGERIAVKRLDITADEAFHRELDVADHLIGGEFQHVLSVLDAGQDANSNRYFIVMSRADKSLQDDIDGRSELGCDQTAEVLKQIASGLSEILELVHRDLKPGNVLYHEGKWKLADFGLARFVERATSLRTVLGYMTPEYAAPEQWNETTTNHATDVYALGCIGYALLTGAPPFVGPQREDFRRQHLHEEPPPLQIADPRLATFLHMMLRKRPEVRPSLGRVQEFLGNVLAGPAVPVMSVGPDRISRAAARIAAEEAEREAAEVRERAHEAAREEIAKEANQILARQIAELYRRIQQRAPNAIVRSAHQSSIERQILDSMLTSISLGGASLVW